jgi:predicted ribosome quality control (RQC) complex YloA/Tae2 family protein
MIAAAKLEPEQNTHDLTLEQWQNLFIQWHFWLTALEKKEFQAIFDHETYSVIPWHHRVTLGEFKHREKINLQRLVNNYYRDQTNTQNFQQLHHQLQQKLHITLKKLRQKADTFASRLKQSKGADLCRKQGDLLMSYLHEWRVGMTEIILTDFESEQPLKISLKPDKNAVQNAQSFYKQHQKLKRASQVVQPLLDEVQAEIHYLEQIEASLEQLVNYQNPDDLETLQEIREELIQQNYLSTNREVNQKKELSKPHIYPTPSGGELWIGRNNQQNDHLTFRVANDYDLWFHSQEIPGSHVLLRLPPGAVPDDQDLQWAADFAAYFSRAKQSEQVPVVYTQPKNVYKPKGTKPGMCIYKRETILWGQPQRAIQAIATQARQEKTVLSN